jgi:hypothetical protein
MEAGAVLGISIVAAQVGDASTEAPLRFATDIKPLFRERDRDSMRRAFDLWSYDDVRAHADAIAARLKAGTMPCDGAWPRERVELFERWLAQGAHE